MTCSDLCTAAKCEELERRIGALEQALELLEASFEAHTQSEIPDAHAYEPSVYLEAILNENILQLKISVDDALDFEVIELPKSEHIESNLKISGFMESDKLYLFIADGESQDSEVIDIYDRTSDLYVENIQLFSAIDGNTLGITATLYMSDGSNRDSNLATVELPPAVENIQLFSAIDGNTLGITATLYMSNGSSRDSNLATVELPMFEPFVTVDVYPTDNNSFVIQVSVNGDSDSDTFTIEIPDMNCDNLSEQIDRCCSNLADLLSQLSLQLSNTESILNQSINEVYNEITIDITGTTESNYQCKFPQREDESFIETYAESVTEVVNYSGTGLTGIHENLKLINTNLTAMYADVCKAIDPINTIEFDDLYKYCYGDSNEIDRSIYFKDNGIEKFVGAADRYQKAVQEYLTRLIEETKYGYLLDERNGNRLITAPNSYITKMLADFALIQGKINNTAICNIDIPEYEESEVVSIVASDKVPRRASGKLLVLHFVTPNNYPKRSRNSTYWQTQIPAALDEYDWCEHFENLTWSRGNCFAELKFNQFNNPVSGFFKDKDAADAYFNRVLTLTTATEKNRVYHEHKTPQTNIIQRVTRPYRAFIESVNNAGQAICHVKYVPPKEPCQ